MVPDATFTSYYGRPVVKASPWQADIPAYLFLGGLAGGSSLLAAGADLTGRPALRRAGRLGAAGAISLSFAALVHDLGRPSRFLNMMRMVKPTSPMSMGTWVLAGFGPLAGLAGAAELAPAIADRLPVLARSVSVAGRPAGLVAAALAPAVASYTAALLADTATPAWSGARRELPFVFAGSAAAAAGGWGMLCAPPDQAGPARRLAVAGALAELAAERVMDTSLGLVAEPLRQGRAGVLMRASKALTAAGAVGALLGRRSRLLSGAAGAALLTGSACTRFGIFEAGQASARDPRYTVVPQRARIESGESVGA
ncbi:MAG TPA: NrfD/PsrC family molybdoenzyme membrane anchor subunit [Jatrophihabitans sp.]|nr:NrfD/PsrC family molybdoenzyme membrane anchor subunit [Jatrophihabitans sp.]